VDGTNGHPGPPDASQYHLRVRCSASSAMHDEENHSVVRRLRDAMLRVAGVRISPQEAPKRACINDGRALYPDCEIQGGKRPDAAAPRRGPALLDPCPTAGV